MNNFRQNFNNNDSDLDNNFDFKREFFKYLYFWKFFLFSFLFCMFVAFSFLRYSSKIYESNAKIQILDKKENSLEMPSAEDLFSNSKINLENELQIIQSSLILEKVIKNLNLNMSVEGVGDLMSSLILNYPFTLKSKTDFDSISDVSYNLELDEKGLFITNDKNDIEYLFRDFSSLKENHDLPFEVSNIKIDKWNEKSYNINFYSTNKLINLIKKSIIVSQVGKKSDIISIKYTSTNIDYAINFLNELIKVFNDDGVEDRRLVHKRTVDFVNSRFIYLSSELDSIEFYKQSFKTKNDLFNLEANSTFSLENSSRSEEQEFSNSNQIFLVSTLLDELLKLDFELLPSNIGIQNIEINTLIQSYNEIVLEQQKFISSAGPKNPSVLQMNKIIFDLKNNIVFSLKNYLSQLNILKEKFSNQSDTYRNLLSKLPEQEKNLRSIERNQKIKESLYLFLLQKGEEAQVSYAITEPSIKVVEYALSSKEPISPDNKIIYILALAFALFIPSLILFLVFLLDTKIHNREDIESHNSSLNVLGEIPFFDLLESEKIFDDPTARSIVSESFRMLMSNTRYLFKDNNKCNVILVTSSIKGEGKTLSALNLSLSFASLNKKVLLIGCDLRNPQIHKYLDEDKNQKGLVDFLVDNKSNWRESLLNKYDKIPSHNILLSGALPPNPLYLINNGNMEILLDQAKKEFDYIIIDSAPTLLVADTKSLFNFADTIIYLTRCNVTDKEILNHISSSSDENKLSISVVLNGVGEKNAYGYSYGYKYGYGYNYKYSYNYGYGYGYEEEK